MKTHLVLAACAALMAGCGQTGDLYLPQSRQGTVITRPAQTPSPAPAPQSPDSAPNDSPGTVDSPSQPTQPAPEVTPPGESKDGKKPKQTGTATPTNR